MKVAVFLPNVHSTCASGNEKTGGKGLSDLSLSLFLVFLYQYPSIFFPPLYIGKVELPLVWSHHLGWSFKILGVQEKPISIFSCIRVIILVVSEL